VAEIEIRVPKEIGLTQKQKDELSKRFQKQLVETVTGKQAAAIAKAKLIVVEVRAKSKNEIV